jgi:pimeloyl-ACP methyl ester carboxylesterase/GNAT superfamily N-acetyltransferase
MTRRPTVVLVHGGPGAPGSLAPLARDLARECRVVEPYQRRSGGQPLTVDRHVADLEEILNESCADARATVVGHSWGAMLALIHAAAHPGRIASLVLVGCGTFDREARAEFQARLDRRIDRALRERLERLEAEEPDPDARLARTANLLLPAYSRDPTVSRLEGERCDARGHRETWSSYLELEARGFVPAAFAAIDVPVLMLHGADDPHPGATIRGSLERHLPRIEYRELARCGHYPWIERAVRPELLEVLLAWIRAHALEPEVRLRPARPAEAPALSRLALRSKGHWGYDREFLRACEKELTLDGAQLARRPTYVLEHEGTIVGFHGLDLDAADGPELEFLYVEPASIGRGYGTTLLRHARAIARAHGRSKMLIVADPHADRFYRAQGAVPIGTRESGSIPGRRLPLFSLRTGPPGPTLASCARRRR